MQLATLMISVCMGIGNCPAKVPFGEPWTGPQATQDCEQEIANLKTQLRQKAPKALVLMHCRIEVVPDNAKPTRF